MNALLIKIMAVGLTLSQLFTRPDEQPKLHFNPQADQPQVAQHLKEGCAFLTKQFQLENLNLEIVLNLVIDNTKKAEADAAKKPVEGEESLSQKMTRQLDFTALLNAYKIYCKNENIPPNGLNLEEVINFYNTAMKDLPDVGHMKTFRLQESATVLDSKGERFSEIYSENNRRVFVPIAQLPEHVKKAFVAAEDKDFYSHKGVDKIGIIRAFATNIMTPGRPQGGSTITQQVVKNLILNDDLTFERKMREMVLATRLEKVLNKDQILELYLNFVYLGRASWGIEMAARSYFKKSAKDLSVAEAALLAGLTKGPNFYNPESQAARAKDRRQYVLARMKEDKYIPEAAFNSATGSQLGIVPFESPHSRGAFYFLDAIAREAKEKGLLGRPYLVRSTIHPEMQKITERALQEGLVEYEGMSGRARWEGPQGSIADDIAKYKTSWKDILPRVKAKLYDVPWTLATVLDTRNPRVGIADGRVLSLRASSNVVRTLKIYDLVFVAVNEAGNQSSASLRAPPQVQGAAVVIENKTGRVLGMTGGFSYAASPLNRALNAIRQPGSTLKPFIYLSALNLGFQPNTLIPDTPVYLPPIERGGKYWSPKNYDGGSRGLVTMRRAVEQSLNLPTARIMSELGKTPTEGLDYIRGVFQELGIYSKPERFFPIVLGAQPARLIDMAVAYATIANDGLKPSVHFIESIEDGGKALYQRPRFNTQPLTSVDRVSFYQLRRILMGTVVRGTATKIKDLDGIVAGKTGTSNNENDAWFIGFTNDITVAVWIGYDDRNVRSNLGARFTGGRVALPIAEKILRGSFQAYKDKEAMAPPPPEVAALVAEYPIDIYSGQFNGGQFREVFRRDQSGSRIVDSTRRILRNQENYLGFGHVGGEEENPYQTPQWTAQEQYRGPYQQNQGGYYQPGSDSQYEQWRRRQRQVDPNLSRPPWNPFQFFGGQ
jgi:1A family penicillin-binding protein